MTSPEITPGRLILSGNRALLREVTANMRSVSILHAGTELVVRFVFYETPTEDEREEASCIGTEVLADFPIIENQFERYDVISAGRINREPNEHVVFERKAE